MILLETIHRVNVTYNLGSLADWLSAIGTIAAFFAVIWQQYRQEKAARSFKIEQSRPRFLRLAGGVIPNEADVLMNKQISSKLLYEIVSKPRKKDTNAHSALLAIKNISRNIIYKLEIIIEYEDKSIQCWKKIGMQSNEVIVLVPSFLKDGERNLSNVNKKRSELKLRFLTPSNEVGFYIYNYENKIGKYIFIKDKWNKKTTPPKGGTLLNRNSEQIKDLNKDFDIQTRKYKLWHSVRYQTLKDHFGKKN